MIVSKTHTFVFWLMITGSLLFFILIIAAVANYYLGWDARLWIYAIADLSKKEDLISFLILIILLTFTVTLLWREANSITISDVEKTISFCNLFTRSTKIYSFQELDGYKDGYQHMRFYDYKVIFLIKDNTRQEKISSLWHSNFSELDNAVGELNYLGREKFNIFR